MFRNKWIQRIKWKYKDINIKCFLCFPFWMCQIFYRRANNITISEALYFWYPGDPEPLLSSDWPMFLIRASHWPILTLGSVGTWDLRASKTFETDLLLLFPELHKAQNNRQVSEVNKQTKNINMKYINKQEFYCIFWDISKLTYAKQKKLSQRLF